MAYLTAQTVRTWYRIHKWISLICMAFLLMQCVTGLPLIFLDGISAHWRGDPPTPELSPETSLANLDQLVTSAIGKEGVFPGQTVRWLSIEDDIGQIWMGLAPSYKAARSLDHIVRFDARSGRLIHAARSGEHTSPLWIGLMFRLHTDLFAGIYGESLLAVMALLFLVATVSGVVLYGPFMRKLPFGTVRKERTARIRWLDLHNLVGIVTVVWVTTVGVTGIINQLSTPLYNTWRSTALSGLLENYKGQPMPAHLSSVQAAYETALRTLPGRAVRSIRFPDGELGSPYHYLIWMKGNTPLTSQLLTPMLVDARSGKLSATLSLPWYLTILLTARSLHFGDYGGLPLKIIWALFDVALIAVLLSGIYLQLSRRKRPLEDELDRLVKLEELATVETPSAGVLAR